MGVVRLQCIVSSSYHDTIHSATNLLYNGLEPKPGMWLSAPEDRSGRMEAEIQLERPSFIHFIDIGNHGSSSVEVFVKNTQKSDRYISLMPAIQMMTPADVKNGTNKQVVKMFSSADFNPEAINEKWNVVRVICSQIYRKDKQFGLSFFHISDKEYTESGRVNNDVHFDFNNVLKSPNQFNRRLSSPSARMSTSSSIVRSRARSLLKAAQKKQLATSSRSPKRALFKEEEENNNSDLEADIMCFLTSIPSASLQNFGDSIDETLIEYEELRNKILKEEEKKVFRRAFLSLVSQEDGILPMSETTATATVSPQHFYPSPSRNGVIKNGHQEESASPAAANSNGLSYDIYFKRPKSSPSRDAVDSPSAQSVSSPSKKLNGSAVGISPEKRPKRKKKYITMKDMLRSPVKHRRTSLVKPASRSAGTNTPHNDFIQSDGSIPSTSKEVIYCPICDEPFHISEIETHAASCGDVGPVMKYPAKKDDEDDDVIMISEAVPRKEASRSSSSLVSCHSDNFVECPICGDMFKQAVVQNHTNMCIENCIA